MLFIVSIVLVMNYSHWQLSVKPGQKQAKANLGFHGSNIKLLISSHVHLEVRVLMIKNE